MWQTPNSAEYKIGNSDFEATERLDAEIVDYIGTYI